MQTADDEWDDDDFGDSYRVPEAASATSARQRRLQIAAIVMCLLMALPILGLLLAQLLG